MVAGAIILSGGKSSRMGTNKALLKINEITNIERVKNQLMESFQDIILVTNEPNEYEFLNIRMTSDQYPGKGPLAGLHAGLVDSDHDVNLVVACDMPFVSNELACYFVEAIGDYDAVIPIINGKQHPLFSVFKKHVIDQIEDSLKSDRLRMKHLLEQIHVRFMTEKDLEKVRLENLERIFFNMNNPTEYEDAKKWAKEDNQKGV
ncbi:MAG: molybdenum cofactor guanylyltransferase [Bacillota bacterium]|nr:molybdenum cofactor guanylyltransferase [Bacillota bacterium]